MYNRVSIVRNSRDRGKITIENYPLSIILIHILSYDCQDRSKVIIIYYRELRTVEIRSIDTRPCLIKIIRLVRNDFF